MTSLAHLSGRVGFLGAGNMASALIRGLTKAGFLPGSIVVTDLDAQKVATLENELGVTRAKSALEVVANADIIVIAVKPGQVPSLLKEVASAASDKLIVSIAAGVTTSAMEAQLGGLPRVVRSMPNTPALAGAGATALSAGRHATENDLEFAEALFRSCGLTVRVDESMMDAVTGLSGSGPAYIMMVIEALADGGVRSGLPRTTATALATQTVLGAAELVRVSGRHPAELKDAVTSPGGTTIAGVHALEAKGVRGAFIDAVVAATARSRELSKG